MISSISGGSFPAAFYGLDGMETFDQFPERFFYRPIQSELVKLALMPNNLLKLAGSTFARSDLAADFYDREVFGGGIYAQLIAKRTQPFVTLNATDMTLGSQFSFTQDQFDLLCSDLADVPLARAAASSSAFPGGLTPLTFQNYASSCGYRQPTWVTLPNSGVSVDIPLLAATYAIDTPDDSITPDVVVKRTFEARCEGKDMEIAAVRADVMATESKRGETPKKPQQSPK